MANGLYDGGRQGFLSGDIDWDGHNIKVALCSSAYTANLASHQFLSDVTGIVATSGNLTGKTVTGGVADASDVTISAVSGAQITQIVIYQDTGSSGTSRLIAKIDTGTGLPVTPNGGDLSIVWSDDANKIFKLLRPG